MAKAERFVARVYAAASIRYVEVPAKVSARFSGSHPAVRATLNGIPFRTTLLPRGGGRFRLAFRAAVRHAAGAVDSGDSVAVTLQPAPPHPVPRMPRELAAALGSKPGGRLAFEAWPPGKRREVFAWLSEAKAEATRARRIALVIRRLGLA
jgi:hypothetical protein